MEQLKYKKLLSIKREADDAYFNSGSPIMSDIEYDELCQQLNQYSELFSVGCIPRTDKIKLPVFMGSLNKYNDQKSLNSFLDKFNHKYFTIQEKLDGVSCLYVCKKNTIRLFTRGNGTVGNDITHLLSYGLKLPQNLNTEIMVRGELIIPKQVFKDEYSLEFKNIRNMVSGQLSKKNPDKLIISEINFVAYEVIEPQTKQKSITEQFQILNTFGFKVVYHRIIEGIRLKKKILMDYLLRRKRKSEYDIDGLVITINEEYSRKENMNPKYSFAFKIKGQIVEAQVDHVKWNLSKSGKYKPQILIRPVNLNGVTISSLTGFNAKYIVDYKITTGSILAITRSGDVIPHIVSVLKEGNCNINLPEQSRWSSVDLYHNFEHIPDEVMVKKIVYFFSSLNCINCKDKTIQKIYNSGYKTIESIIRAQTDELSHIKGIGIILATKLTKSIKENIKVASIHELLAALNSFGEGIGLKKIKNINIEDPYKQVSGLSETTLKEKIIPVWEESLNRVKNIKNMVGAEFKTEENSINVEGSFKDKIFVFTGFRDTLLERQILDLGGKVSTAISKKTTCLVTSNHNIKESIKLKKAVNLGIKITTKSELILDIKANQISRKEIEYSDYESSDTEL